MSEAERTLKPMLAVVLEEAAHMAFVDTCYLPGRELTDEERRAWLEDIHAIPGEALGNMDPMAFCQNLSCRLLGTGGWELPGPEGPVYTPNATKGEVFELSFVNPDRSFIDELTFDILGGFADASPPEAPDA